jgi:hypothetical protein
MQNLFTPASFASVAFSRIAPSFTRGKTGMSALLLDDWAQYEQSSEQAPDLAFMIEQRSTRAPLNLSRTRDAEEKS